MRPDLEAAVARLVAERETQGFGPKVVDPEVLATVAAVLAKPGGRE